MGARVELCDPAHQVIGLALVSYEARHLQWGLDHPGATMASTLGYIYTPAVIMAADVVISDDTDDTTPRETINAAGSYR